MSRAVRYPLAVLVLSLPLTLGARGDGCAAYSRSPAPDLEGSWAIEYDDQIDVSIELGGVVYEETLGAAGGVIEITHDGRPLTFDLDCARPEILCPSEAWPRTVQVRQDQAMYEHQMIVTLPTQSCEGELVEPAPSECGPGTLNEDCEAVCDGPIRVDEVERFGVIGEAGETFRLYLGAGIATNGINCALLAASVADADLATVEEDDTWRATAMEAGLVTVGYAGGCLWAGDPDMDGDLEALVLGAEVVFRTGFTGTRE